MQGNRPPAIVYRLVPLYLGTFLLLLKRKTLGRFKNALGLIICTMADKLRGKVYQKKLDIHDNYDYEHKEVADSDHFVFKRGDEAVTVALSHPHVEELQESSQNPHTQGEWVHGGWDEKGNYLGHHQHTFWDRPHGRSTGPKITGLFATPGAKADVGTAIGVAVNHSIKRFGQIPEASDDLSPHSLPVVQRITKALKEKNVTGVKSYVPGYARNEITKEEGLGAKAQADKWFGQDRSVYGYHAYKHIPGEHLESGSKLMRGIFAGRHLNKQQFTQPELPFGDK